MLYTNYQGSSRFLQDSFQDFPTLLYINQIWPPSLYLRHNLNILSSKQFRTISIILVKDHTGTIPVEFDQILIIGSRVDVV